MSYQNEAAKIDPGQVEFLLRALDTIAHTSPTARPGHMEYRTKQQMIDIAAGALAIVRASESERV